MIKILLYLIALALLHSKLELMIEGKRNGWAFNLPCWRADNIITRILVGKEITGYHFYLCLMFLLIFHSPLLFLDFTWQLESLILGWYFIYWVMEDFAWFAINNVYGIRSFRKGKIWWHRRWFFYLPVSYWSSLIIGGLFLWLATL